MSGIRNLTVVVPFFNGHDHLYKLVKSLPEDLPVLIMDDQSDIPLTRQEWMGENVKVWRMQSKGYFAGAVNTGFKLCSTDVLVLNQDTWFENGEWIEVIEKNREHYAFIGERIRGNHPTFGGMGYIHGTFAFFRRDALDTVGQLNQHDYPLWGNTAEWQLRATRHNFSALPLREIPGFHHERPQNKQFGKSIETLLKREHNNNEILVRVPPLLSVIVPCYNYGRYVSDCIASLIGGKSSLGQMAPQTLQSFEVIIVNDASTDNSKELIEAVVDESKGIRAYHLARNVGTAKTLNFGIDKAFGKYITFLSADDMREADSLEKLVRACEKNPHSFAYDDIWLFHTKERIKKWRMEDYDFERLLYKNHIHAGIVFPKSAWEEVGGYPGIMDNGREDWAFNVALGIHGYCGVHVLNYGYLYRREEQNRSITNTTPSHREVFLGKLQSLFPAIYGGHRPMACCGKGGAKHGSPAARSQASIAAKTVTLSMNGGNTFMASAPAGSEGMVKLEYTGRQMTAVWDGPATGVRYRFGADKPVGWVDKRDVGERNKAGFLNLKDRHNNFLFQLKDSVAPEPVAETVPQEVVATVVGEAKAEKLTGVEDAVSATVVEEKEPEVDFPNPSDFYPADIQKMDLTKEQWQALYRSEMANRRRKKVITFVEEKIASE
jgi:glycosyltransferase involved in cell wall biosynthesis